MFARIQKGTKTHKRLRSKFVIDQIQNLQTLTTKVLSFTHELFTNIQISSILSKRDAFQTKNAVEPRKFKFSFKKKKKYHR